MEKIRVGVGRVKIIPPVGIYLIGMERFEDSHGLRDDLYATALALSDGATETVLVRLDVLFVHPELIRRVREQVEAHLHIPGQNLLPCTAHFHSGAEIFSKTGLAIKRLSPFKQTLFAGYTNGKVGYISLLEDYPGGAYEVNEAYLGARLPAPLGPQASSLVEQTALELLEEIFSQAAGKI